jgi:hypothetical protein
MTPMKARLSLAVVISAVLAGSAVAAADDSPAAADESFFAGLRDIQSQARQRERQFKADTAADIPDLSPTETKAAPEYTVVRRGDAYFIYGAGTASNDGGKVGGPVFEAGLEEQFSKHWSVGLVHKNEGHPDGAAVGHRDGYAALGWFSEPLGDRITVKAGAGPYFSMNTVTIDGAQRDDKNWGAIAALALVYRLNRYGLNARAQIDETKIPGQFSTTIIMAGLSQDLGGKSSEDESSEPLGAGKTSFGLWAGSDVTNRSGQKRHMGYEADVQRAIDEQFAYSVDFIDEGNSGLTDRKGVAGQVWYVAPAGGKWTFSAGAGPYVAHESAPGERGAKLLALVSFKASRQMTKNVSLSCRMNRAVSGYDKDADMFLCGVEAQE